MSRLSSDGREFVLNDDDFCAITQMLADDEDGSFCEITQVVAASQSGESIYIYIYLQCSLLSVGDDVNCEINQVVAESGARLLSVAATSRLSLDSLDLDDDAHIGES
jgi:hypothetical protein